MENSASESVQIRPRDWLQNQWRRAKDRIQSNQMESFGVQADGSYPPPSQPTVEIEKLDHKNK